MNKEHTNDYIILKLIRVSLDLSRTEFANYLNVSRTYISMIEKRERIVPIDVLKKWLNIINISYADYLKLSKYVSNIEKKDMDERLKYSKLLLKTLLIVYPELQQNNKLKKINSMTINYSDQKVIKNKKSIFLAGPTPRGENIVSWRIDACKFLEENGFDGVVYVPEYSTWKPKSDYVDQAQWERDALLNASVIAFWIPRELPNMPAFTTNVEFGYWLHTGKVLYGRPDNAKKIKYLDWLYKVDTDMEPYNSIEDLLLSSITKANEVGINYKNEMFPLQKRKLLK